MNVLFLLYLRGEYVACFGTTLTLLGLGFLRMARLGEGGGGVPAAYNSKTINDNEVKFGGEVENH